MPPRRCTPASPQAHRGFFGRSLQPGCVGPRCPPGAEPDCNFPPTLPFVDLLPRGAQNFWTGSQRCPVSPLRQGRRSRLALQPCAGCV
jgi:hypothetical protein